MVSSQVCHRLDGLEDSNTDRRDTVRVCHRLDGLEVVKVRFNF